MKYSVPDRLEDHCKSEWGHILERVVIVGPELRAVESPNLRLSPSEASDLLQMMLSTLNSLNTIQKVQYFPKAPKIWKSR